MSEETFVVELAGLRWALPHLPFRVIKTIQPALFQIYNDAGGDEMTARTIAALGEAEIERLARATWQAVSFVEPTLTFDDFQNMAFSVGDLLSAFPAIAKSAGLRPKSDMATQEASPSSGKSTLTP